MKLDKKQSYGQISGDHHGAAFEQNGRIFDADGEEIIIPTVGEVAADPGDTVTAAPKAIKPKSAPAKAATKGPKKKAVPPESPTAPAVDDVAKASAVDDQLAAQ